MMNGRKPPRPPSADDYEVGHGRPPKTTQFQKGQSGNTRGRPRKRAPSKIADTFREMMEEPIALRLDNGRSMRIAFSEALVMKTKQQAMKGDLKAQGILYGLMKHFGLMAPVVEQLSAEDAAAKARMVASLNILLNWVASQKKAGYIVNDGRGGFRFADWVVESGKARGVKRYRPPGDEAPAT